MKFKNVIILIMLLILSLSIGVVSASDSADLNTDINTVNTEHNNLNTNINTINTEDYELKINNTTYYKNDISNLNDTSKININPILEEESAKNLNNSNKVSTTVKTKTVYVKTSEVINAAISLKSFVKKNKALPVDIKVGKIQVSTIQFSYLMIETIKNIKNKKLSSKIKVIDVKIKNPYSKSVYKKIKKLPYLKGANNVNKFIKTNKRVPNYLKIKNIKIGYETYTYGFAKILAFYKSHKRLPNYYIFDSHVFKKAKATKIYSNNLNIYIGNNNYLTATLKNSEGKLLSNKKLSLNYNNKKYTAKTNKKGVVKWKLSFNKEGKYTGIIKFTGDSKNLPSKVSSKINVYKKITTKIYCSNLEVYYGNDAYLTATLKDIEGTVLSNKNLSLYYNNKNYITKTNNNGIAKWKLSFNNGGNYTTEIKFAGDSKNLPSKTTNKITVHNEVKFNDIIKSSLDLRNYVLTNHSLPNEIIIDNYKLTTAEFSYLMANAINNINKGDILSDIYIHKVKVNNKGGNLINFVVGKNNFINLTENVIKLGDSNNTLPSTFKVYNVNVEDRIGKDADFNLYTSGFARILNYYNSNNELPDYCTFNSYELNNYISINDVVIASSNLKEFIVTNYYVPAYFNVGNYNVSSAQISYLMAVAIKNINNKNNSDILIKELSLKTDLGDEFSIDIPLSLYIELANNVSSYCDKNSYPPSIISIYDKKAQFKTYTLGFATILDYYKQNNKLPEKSLFSTKIYENYPMYKTINEINTEDNLTKYIESENEWCVITQELQDIANELVSNFSSKLDLAINIFNYINDATEYIFYYNSQKGAQGTLTEGGGNCCDLSHLLIAIFRASGLPARYCHGLCTFISGTVTGHVWVQVCVDNIWYVCDASNYVNTFGHIENWFIDSSSFNNYYVLLPF